MPQNAGKGGDFWGGHGAPSAPPHLAQKRDVLEVPLLKVRGVLAHGEGLITPETVPERHVRGRQVREQLVIWGR